MQVVPSTLLAVGLLVWLLRRGPYYGLPVLFFSLPFGMAAAVNLPAVGNTSILAADLVVLALATLLLLRTQTMHNLARLLSPGQAALPILGFFAYAVLATLFFPRIFAGETEVFSLTRSARGPGIELQPLKAGVGNLAQFLRLILSLLVFAVSALVMMRRRDPKVALNAMIIVTLVHSALGIIDMVTQATGTTWILEPFRTANYALTLGQRTVGLDRLIGGFPEASAFGYLSIAIFAFWLGYWYHHRDGSRLPLFMMLLSLFLVVRGTSSAAYVGAGLVVSLFAVQRMAEVFRGSGALDPRLAAVLTGFFAILPASILGSYMLYELLPQFAAFVDRTLLDKLESQSGVERMSWNLQAMRNFLDTFMLGAGLGSVRASSWLTATLGTTGLIGFALMVAFLWRVFTTPIAGLDPAGRNIALALKLGLAGCLARAIVVKASPNLDFIFFAMAGLLVGMSLSVQAHRSRLRGSGHAPLTA